jgi:hypothetical protein
MVTYREIQNYVKEKHGFTVKTCWTADAKEKAGLLVKLSSRRQDKNRKHPCPKSKEEYIFEALRHFGMMERNPPCYNVPKCRFFR